MRLQDLGSDVDHLRETRLDSEQLASGGFIELRRDRISLPDGSVSRREYVVHPGAVMIVPVRDDGRLVVERQWRYPIGRAMLEFPAGKLEAGEPSLQCAVRELFEETGYRAAEWARAGVMHNAMAYSTEAIEVWFARGLTAGERRLDAGEFLDVFDASLAELEASAAAGALSDAESLIGMTWLRAWREGRWPVEWRGP